MDKSKVFAIHEQTEQLTAMLWVLSEALGNGGNLDTHLYETMAVQMANMSADITAAVKQLGEDA
jgi:hypothetical protein